MPQVRHLFVHWTQTKQPPPLAQFWSGIHLFVETPFVAPNLCRQQKVVFNAKHYLHRVEQIPRMSSQVQLLDSQPWKLSLWCFILWVGGVAINNHTIQSSEPKTMRRHRIGHWIGHSCSGKRKPKCRSFWKRKITVSTDIDSPRNKFCSFNMTVVKVIFVIMCLMLVCFVTLSEKQQLSNLWIVQSLRSSDLLICVSVVCWLPRPVPKHKDRRVDQSAYCIHLWNSRMREKTRDADSLAGTQRAHIQFLH